MQHKNPRPVNRETALQLEVIRLRKELKKLQKKYEHLLEFNVGLMDEELQPYDLTRFGKFGRN